MSTDNERLLAGAASADITPRAGTHLSGSGAGEHRPAQSVMDPLSAKAVVIGSAGRRVCLVALDVTIVTGDHADQIRADICRETGIPHDAILVHATQTHSAPSVGHFMLDADFALETTPETEYLRGAETPYAEFAIAGAVRAAAEAASSLQPVRLGVGRGLVDGLAFNRRGVRRDGSVMMPKPQGRENQPLGLTELCYLEGPVDPEVGVVCLQSESMAPLAFLLHYTCHPVNVFGYRETYYAVSADWPGAWARAMQSAYGETTAALVLNGCCGNLNPWNPFEPDDRPDHRRMGHRLGDTAQQVTHSMAFTTDCPVDWRVRRVSLPYREIPKERRREVGRILAENPAPPWQANGQIDPTWFRAASTRSVELCGQREPALDYEIQVLRIGDVAIVGLPGEPFVEGQLQIKTCSAAPFTFCAHCSTHYVGYLPTREAYGRGGHEANEDATYWAKLAPGCLETVVEESRRGVEEMFGRAGVESPP